MPGRSDARDFDRLQTMRLARTVLEQSDTDVGRIADDNPALVAEWSDELAEHRTALLAEADELRRAAERLKHHVERHGRSAA